MKKRGLTLMEVLIAVSIIAIVSGITFMITTKVKRQIIMTNCVSNLQKIHTALMLYRVEYGIVNYGDYRTLGLPTDVYYGYGKDKVLIGDYEDWVCPTPLPNRGSYWPHYEYLPLYDDFTDAFTKYQGKTPLVVEGRNIYIGAVETLLFIASELHYYDDAPTSVERVKIGNKKFSEWFKSKGLKQHYNVQVDALVDFE